MFARLTHFLLPQESNNYRAKILHSRSISIFSIGFLVFQLILSGFVIAKPNVLGYASQISVEKVIELTNQERIKAGVPVLTINASLSEAAGRKAGDMYAFNYWAHVSPSGREPWAFFKEAGYNYVFAGENLARDFSSAETAVEAWMASPSHKENLINPRYKEIGIAVVDGTLNGVDTTLIVQLFGTQAGQSNTQAKAIIPPVTTEKVVPTGIPQVPEITKVPEPVRVEDNTIKIPVITTSTNPVLSKSSGKEIPVINPFTVTQIIGVGSLIILIGLFIIDTIVVWRKGIFRLTGHSFAHTLFLLAIMLIALLSERGIIM